MEGWTRAAAKNCRQARAEEMLRPPSLRMFDPEIDESLCCLRNFRSLKVGASMIFIFCCLCASQGNLQQTVCLVDSGKLEAGL